MRMKKIPGSTQRETIDAEGLLDEALRWQMSMKKISEM